MFLRSIKRKEDGKAHTYGSVFENKRRDHGWSVQRPIVNLGATNSSQAIARRRAIGVINQDHGRRTLAFFPWDRSDDLADDTLVVMLRPGRVAVAAPAAKVRQLAG